MLIVIGGVLFSMVHAADDIQFNTDVLDINDRQTFDLSQFSQGGFILPGTYNMVVRINKQELSELPVNFVHPENDPKGSDVCLSPEQTLLLGIKPEFLDQLQWTHKGSCLLVSSLPGMEARGDLASSSLYLNVPQAYLEYNSDSWDPPSRWDNGIPGVLFDYNLNTQTIHQQKQGTNGYTLSGNGTTGANIGTWRLRADWQTRLDHTTGSGQPTQNSWDWSRYYLYRPIASLGAKLVMGEDYLDSNMFDSFRFTGFSLNSDDNMLPPNLRGYAPEVTGIARTNARVTISQQGRVLYETQVASGPFRIQDINDAVSGELDVRVEEQDGTVQSFQINTASIPYLTRPGTVRYKLASGRPSDFGHHTNDSMFAAGEFSWGISNGWSLYGGALGSSDYNALSVGVGRDLMMLGALSFDMTQSRAHLPQEQEGYLSGGSYRLSYSKRFDEMNSQLTFAGYRFSERDFMSMSEFLDAKDSGTHRGGSKDLYTVTYSQQFRDLGFNAYLNYSHQTYWELSDNDRYSISLSRNFDIGTFKNLSLSVSAYRNQYYNTMDEGGYLSLSVPWGNGGSVSYNTSVNRTDTTHRVSYYNRLDDRTQYQMSVGASDSGASTSEYISHRGDMAQVNVNAGYQEGRYSSVGMSLQGGGTVTLEGAALHRVSIIGGTRLLIDTDGVADVPVRGYGSTIRSNQFGKAVVTDVNSYYRNKASVDLSNLANNAEVIRSVVQATLTEGAIGYRKFEVISGEKTMAVIKLADGSAPPFGAMVLNRKNQEVGIVNDGGSVYLSGINAGESMTVHWNGREQCVIALPNLLKISEQPNLLLPCSLSLSETVTGGEHSTQRAPKNSIVGAGLVSR
nr:outer membrane usher protein [Serratia proteamaculans]